MENNEKENFRTEIVIDNDRDEKRLIELKEKYENNEIFENDLSNEEIKGLIELYKQEENKLNEEILKRKLRIANMLRKL